jgi:uncharacterized membrane protein YraQ (UPF0718 family)
VNEAAIALFIGLFGWKITLLYAGAGISLGVLGGAILSRVNVSSHISPDIVKLTKHVHPASEAMQIPKFSRKLLGRWWSEGFALTKKLILYVLLGVAIGAAIHGYVPQGFFENALSNDSWWTVPLATIVAVPLYSNAVGVIPIMQALVVKGVPLGTALAFMMATVGLSLPEALILKKVMSWRLLAMYFSAVTVGIICIGYLFNLVM